jgi:diaminohydroxyphosphoribosylaminopyrimidine deaminase / 5-amino-6-(5-phosphoribosylamino)uracil reductase
MLTDQRYLRLALRLARRGYGTTSPNPMVGALLVRGGKAIGRGWHRRAGEPHAEIEALRDARQHGYPCRGATLFVTLEPCSTQGRTPPCTAAIIAAGIQRVVVGVTDPNPRHAGRGFAQLRKAGIAVTRDVMAEECAGLNESFNHWIVHRTPYVTVKAAMTLDGKIATASGESQWITGPRARAAGMELRRGADAILVGIGTVLADDPSLTLRPAKPGIPPRRRIVLDAYARTPLHAKLVSDGCAASTIIAVSQAAPQSRVASLSRRVRVLAAPARDGRIDLRWLLKALGAEAITSLLVEGGGEVNASFLLQHLAHRVAFFYAPKILGGREARKAVAGEGARNLREALTLRDLEWRRLGADWLLTARVEP